MLQPNTPGTMLSNGSSDTIVVSALTARVQYISLWRLYIVKGDFLASFFHL